MMIITFSRWPSNGWPFQTTTSGCTTTRKSCTWSSEWSKQNVQVTWPSYISPDIRIVSPPGWPSSSPVPWSSTNIPTMSRFVNSAWRVVSFHIIPSKKGSLLNNNSHFYSLTNPNIIQIQLTPTQTFTYLNTSTIIIWSALFIDYFHPQCRTQQMIWCSCGLLLRR